jgi:hypothetical protein
MTTIAIKHETGLLHSMAATLRNCVKRIKKLFTLEEVEVTFTQVGHSTRYSYTKISQKHAA